MDFLFAPSLSEYIVCICVVLQRALKQFPISRGRNDRQDGLGSHAVGCRGRQALLGHPPKACYVKKQRARRVRNREERARRKQCTLIKNIIDRLVSVSQEQK